MVFIGFSNASELLVQKTLEQPIKTRKNHDFQTLVQENQKFMVLIGFPMFLSFWLRKHWKNNKNHEFLIFLHHSLKIMFFFLIGCANVSELLVMVFHGFYWFLQ